MLGLVKIIVKYKIENVLVTITVLSKVDWEITISIPLKEQPFILEIGMVMIFFIIPTLVYSMEHRKRKVCVVFENMKGNKEK